MPVNVACGGGIGLGNQMTGALTGIVNMMILNYTLTMTGMNCEDHLMYKPWIPSLLYRSSFSKCSWLQGEILKCACQSA
jgi:hypothetical protein